MGFFKEGMRLGLIHNVTISGPVRDEPTEYSYFIFLKPNPLNPEENLIKSIATGSLSAKEIYDKVLSVKLSDRVTKIKVPANEEKQNLARKFFAQAEIPHIMVALGRIRRTKEEVISLSSISLVPPVEAFAQVQTKLRERRNRLN